MCRVNPHISASARPPGDSDAWHVTLTLKPSKDATIKGSYRPISLMKIKTKILDKTLWNWIQKYMKTIIHWWGGIYFRDTSMIQHLINVIYHKVKNKNHHLSRWRKSIWQNPTFICDDSQQSGFRGKVLYDKLTASIILNSERLKAFPLRSGIKKMPILITFI